LKKAPFVKDRSNYPTLDNFSRFFWSGFDLDGFGVVVGAIAEAAIEVQEKVRAAMLANVVGTTGEVNVQGEVVQILDTFSSDTFVEKLSQSQRVAAVGSEEIDETVIVGDGPQHNYIVLLDPLDGSSNIDVAVSVGSILGIWRRNPQEPISDDYLLKKGCEQVGAVYTVYGSSTILVVATKGNVQGFTLDPVDEKFRLTYPDIRIPQKNSCYSTNEGNFSSWDESTQRAVSYLREHYSLRYVGSLVADFHRNLLKGGMFLYPGTLQKPEGKLRLMYEANPLGFIAEQAGGAASSGLQNILDIEPQDLHQRIPLIIGNKDVVEKTVSMIQGS
jgi:fructose-1,6-bisphosphatase I